MILTNNLFEIKYVFKIVFLKLLVQLFIFLTKRIFVVSEDVFNAEAFYFFGRLLKYH